MPPLLEEGGGVERHHMSNRELYLGFRVQGLRIRDQCLGCTFPIEAMDISVPIRDSIRHYT